MASFLLRNKLFFNNIRRFHKNLPLTDTPTYNIKNREALLKIFPEVIDTIGNGPILSTQPTVANWVKEMFQYVLTGGKLNRAHDVTAAYVMLEAPENITDKNIHSAHIMGWCAEMMHAYIYMIDDIMDSSTTRRKKLCWHRQPHVGINAVNDTTLIHQAILELLETKFKQTPIYLDVVKLVNETLYCAAIGQQLDNFTVYSKKKNNLEGFTMDNFNVTAIHKTAYSTMRLPLHMGLLLVKDGRQKLTQEWTDICYNLGQLFQLHNDYSDAYVKESESGKAGYDIQEGKLTWLAVTALPRCNAQQLATFKEFYGSPDPDHAKRIKQLYDDLNMPQLYEEFESKQYSGLLTRIKALPTKGERTFFLNLLEGWYQNAY